MFKLDTWYKSERMNLFGLFNGRYTYFKCFEEDEEYTKCWVYDLCDDIENPKCIAYFRKDGFEDCREVKEEEIDEDIKYLATLLIGDF